MEERLVIVINEDINMLIKKTVPYNTIAFDAYAAFSKNISRIINTIAFICFNNVQGYFFLGIICLSRLRVFMGLALGKFIPSAGQDQIMFAVRVKKVEEPKQPKKYRKRLFFRWKTETQSK